MLCEKCGGELEMGYGLAGGGIGPYLYCLQCFHVAEKFKTRRWKMPEKYLKMRDKFAKKMGMAAAKTKAARLYNSQRPKGTKPVTSHYETKKK